MGRGEGREEREEREGREGREEREGREGLEGLEGLVPTVKGHSVNASMQAQKSWQTKSCLTSKF